MTAQHNPPSPASENILQASLLEAFDRFYCVASFYPPEHAQCQGALSNLYKTIDETIPSGESMLMEPTQDGIRLQGTFLDHTHQGSKNFSGLLEILGIARLKINRNAPLSELHSMVSSLNSLKLEAGSFLEFHSLDFQELPGSVEIVQRKFGWRQLNLGLDSTMSEKLLQQMNQLMDMVQQQPWSDARKEEFRLQTESFLVKTIERMDTSLVRSIQSQRNLEEVLMLGSSVVKNAISSLDGDQDPRSVNDVFNQAAESLAYNDESSSLEIMFEVLREGSGNQNNDVAVINVPQLDETAYSESIEDLTAKVMKISATATEPEISSGDFSQEILLICLKMASAGVTDNHFKPLRKLLSRQLAPPMGIEKSKLLENAVSDLVENGDRNPVDQVLPLLIPHLLRNNSEDFAKFLNQISPPTDPEKLAIVWPHLVGMMLMPKPPRNTALLTYLNTAIPSLPLDSMREEAHRLDFLTIIKTGKIGTDLMHWPIKKSSGVLKTLLTGRQSNQVGQRLNHIWTDKAPNKLAGVLMRVLGSYQPEHMKLYMTILNFSSNGKLDGETRSEISQLIQETLGNLDKSSRDVGWVPYAISELGNLGLEKNLTFLDEITNEKHHFIMHSWPKSSRKAAQEAMKTITAGQSRSQP